MIGRVTVFLLTVALLTIPAVMIISTVIEKPVPTPVYSQQATEDLIVSFDYACGPVEGIFYRKISEGADAVIGFVMTDEQFKKVCLEIGS